jgi:hypothetical protein
MNVFAESMCALRCASRVGGFALVSVIVTWPALAEPQYIRNLSQHGYLTSPTVNPPIVTLTAGDRFSGLVPASQRELCEIALGYYAGADGAVKTVRIVDRAGQGLLTCGA